MVKDGIITQIQFGSKLSRKCYFLKKKSVHGLINKSTVIYNISTFAPT